VYQPNFCAECGERVVRERWRVWMSGRFCDDCGRRFRVRRIYAPLGLCAVLLGAGFVAGRAGRPAQPPLVVIKGGAVDAHATHGKAETDARGHAASSGAVTAKASSASEGADGTAGERPTDPAEVVSICGARTKKGTPCSRRVRGTGRCWQHRGRSAILPPAKLTVQE
jgi:hypothetical protein